VKLTSDLGRVPELSEVAAELGVSEDRVTEVLNAANQGTSLEAPVMEDDGASEMKDMIAVSVLGVWVWGALVPGGWLQRFCSDLSLHGHLSLPLLVAELENVVSCGDSCACMTWCAVACAVQDDRATPDEMMEDDMLKRCMESVLEELTPREAEVLRMHWGLDGQPERTLEEIGQMFNVTRERARQLESRALQKLKEHQGKIEGIMNELQLVTVEDGSSAGARASRGTRKT
jgi:RNA polymerase sigma factor (sigma-70 family)